jgi:hypothetical protein
MGYSGAQGKLIPEKNLKLKISCQSPFNILCYLAMRYTCKSQNQTYRTNVPISNITCPENYFEFNSRYIL